MKKQVLSLCMAMIAITMSAQEIVVGEMNDDGKVTICDVTSVAQTALGKVPLRTISTACDPDKSTPEAVTGKWRSVSSDVLTLNADGTAVITATAKDGTGKSAKCVVMVNQMVTTITLSQTFLRLDVDDSQKLTATVLPEDATNKNVTWTSSNEDVAMVLKGTVVAMGYGTAVITCAAQDGSGVVGTCTVLVKAPNTDTKEYVDLGLSVKWATCNVGASTPEEYGDYFAWGETTGHSSDTSDGYLFDWVNTPYQTANTTSYSSTKWTKYLGSTTSSYKDPSATDEDALKTVLDPEDDAATVNWGGDWCMPTDDQWTELLDNCTWTWDSTKKGYTVTSKVSGYEGNSIFLPAAGYRYGSSLYDAGSYGYYWSRTLISSDPYYAYYVDFGSSGVDGYCNYRCGGQSVRPVLAR